MNTLTKLSYYLEPTYTGDIIKSMSSGNKYVITKVKNNPGIPVQMEFVMFDIKYQQVKSMKKSTFIKVYNT